MFDSLVVVHPEKGVFVGAAYGVPFWSNMDWAPEVVTFETQKEALGILSQWDENVGVHFRFVPVKCESEFHASYDELKEAGIDEESLGLMCEQSPSMGM